MVKRDPLPDLRKIGISTAIFGIIGEILLLLNSAGILSFVIMLPLIYFGAALFKYLSPWAQVEKRRQLAALQKKKYVHRASKQPVPDETVLTLPCTIRLRPKWTIPLICFGVLAPSTSAALLLLAYTIPPVPDWVPVAIIGTSVFFAALVASIPLVLGWQRIKVSEKGINVQECSVPSIGCNQRTIKWSEIRLFAIYLTRKPADQQICYELAGPTIIVRWRRMRPDASFHFTKPPASFDEYDRQMDALLSVIAAKTGLPLYDLR